MSDTEVRAAGDGALPLGSGQTVGTPLWGSVEGGGGQRQVCGKGCHLSQVAYLE